MNRSFRILTAICAAAGLSIGAAAEDDAKKIDLTGDWAGEVDLITSQTRLLFRIQEHPNGNISATVSAPDKSELPVPVTVIFRKDRNVSIDVDSIGGKYRGKLSANGKSIRGEWISSDHTLPLDLDFVDGGFAQNRPQTPKPPFDYTVEEVTFENRFANIRLAGTLTVPKSRPLAGNGHPAVVLVSDFGPHDRDAQDNDHRPFAVVADYLTRNGIAVLRYDDRGTGKSTGTHSFGTTADFATDAWSAVDYLSKRSDIASKKIGLLGHGEGALIANIVCEKRDDIAFVVLLGAPGLRGDSTLLAQTEALALASGVSKGTRELLAEFTGAIYGLLIGDPAAGLAEAQRLGAEFEKRTKALAPEDAAKLGEVGLMLSRQLKGLESEASPWLTRFVALDPGPGLTSMACPVLALSGENDLETPASVHLPAIEARLKAGGNADFETRTLSGLNHRLQKTDNGAPSLYGTVEETFAPSALRIITDWVSERVKR